MFNEFYFALLVLTFGGGGILAYIVLSWRQRAEEYDRIERQLNEQAEVAKKRRIESEAYSKPVDYPRDVDGL